MGSLLEAIKSRAEAERDYEGGAKRLSELISSRGLVRIYAFPSFEASLAAGIMVRVLEEEGIPYTLHFTPIYTRELHDHNSVNIVIDVVLSPDTPSEDLVIFTRDERSVQAKGGVVFKGLTANDSIPSIVIRALSELWIIPQDLLVVPGLLFIERCEEEVSGLDAEYLIEAEKRGLIEGTTSVKFFYADDAPAYKALSETLRPYIPGITGRPEEAARMLQELGVDPRSSLIRLSERELSSVVKNVYLMLQRSSKRRRGVYELVGRVYKLRKALSGLASLKGLRELGALYLALFDHYGPHHLAYSTLADYYVRRAQPMLRKLPKALDEAVNSIATYNGHGKVIETPIGAVRGLAILALRDLGLVEANDVVIVKEAGRYILPYTEIRRSIGESALLKMLGKGVTLDVRGVVFNDLDEAIKVIEHAG